MPKKLGNFLALAIKKFCIWKWYWI